MALGDVPELNAAVVDGQIVRYGDINIGLVIGMVEGMMIPVIRRAGAQELHQLAATTKRLRDLALAGTLSQADLTGGTFTISNLGMFGVEEFPCGDQSAGGGNPRAGCRPAAAGRRRGPHRGPFPHDGHAFGGSSPGGRNHRGPVLGPSASIVGKSRFAFADDGGDRIVTTETVCEMFRRMVFIRRFEEYLHTFSARPGARHVAPMPGTGGRGGWRLSAVRTDE